MNLCAVDLTSSQIADPHRELSTQQTIDFLSHCEDEYCFPSLDSEFERALTQIEFSSVVEDSLTARSEGTDQPCTSTSVTMAKTIAFSSTSTRAYGSPKGEKAIEVARRGSVPKKTRDNPEWSVKVWADWASSRNNKLLPGEVPFSTDFCELTVSEMNFWLSQFVLEICKKNGKSEYSLPANLWLATPAS